MIYDNQRQLDHDGLATFRTVGGPFYMLSPGETFNLKTREPFRPGGGDSTFRRVIANEWAKKN